MEFQNPTNIQAGYEAVIERSLGESQEDYEARITKIRVEFGPHDSSAEEPIPLPPALPES